MSLKLSEINGYGTGAPGTPETLNPSTINSYARVSALTSTSVTINLSAAQLGSYEKFTVGTEILFHGTASREYLLQRYSKTYRRKFDA